MNAKTFATASLFALLSLGAVAAQAATGTQQNPEMTQYQYGQHLDVKKVLSIQNASSNACGVVKTSMDYLDSHGQQHDLQYLSYATDGCHDH